MLNASRKIITPPLLRVSFVMALLIVASPLRSEVRILFSSSLNGNLDGCGCRVHPVSGLVKRGAFITAYRKQHPASILVDSGDLIARPLRPELDRAIYASYAELGYDALLPGDQDLLLEYDFFRKLQSPAAWVLSNVRLPGKGFFSGATRFPIPSRRRLERNGKSIVILGIVHPAALRFYPRAGKELLQIDDYEPYLGNAPQADLLIVLSHGGVDADRAMLAKFRRPAIVIGGHDQSLFRPGPGKKFGESLWYFQSGRDGNLLGEVVLEPTGGGKFKLLSQRLIEFDYKSSPDHPGIRARIEALRPPGTRSGH